MPAGVVGGTGVDQAATRNLASEQVQRSDLDTTAPPAPIEEPTSLDTNATKTQGDAGGLDVSQSTLGGFDIAKQSVEESTSVIGEAPNILDQQSGMPGIDLSSASKSPTEAIAPEPPPAATATTEQAPDPSRVADFLKGLQGVSPNADASPGDAKTQIGDYGIADNKSPVGQPTEASPTESLQEEHSEEVAPAADGAVKSAEDAVGETTPPQIPQVFDTSVATTEPPSVPTPAEDAVTQEQTVSPAPETQDKTPRGLFGKFEETLKENGIQCVKYSSPDGSKILIGFDEKQD